MSVKNSPQPSFTICHVPPQGTFPWAISTSVADPYPCFAICAAQPFVAIQPQTTSFLCQCGPTLPATSHAACAPNNNFYYGGDVVPSAGIRRRKELALKAGEDKGLCPAGLEACSVLGTPGGYEVRLSRTITHGLVQI